MKSNQSGLPPDRRKDITSKVKKSLHSHPINNFSIAKPQAENESGGLQGKTLQVDSPEKTALLKTGDQFQLGQPQTSVLNSALQSIQLSRGNSNLSIGLRMPEILGTESVGVGSCQTLVQHRELYQVNMQRQPPKEGSFFKQAENHLGEFQSISSSDLRGEPTMISRSRPIAADSSEAAANFINRTQNNHTVASTQILKSTISSQHHLPQQNTISIIGKPGKQGYPPHQLNNRHRHDSVQNPPLKRVGKQGSGSNQPIPISRANATQSSILPKDLKSKKGNSLAGGATMSTFISVNQSNNSNSHRSKFVKHQNRNAIQAQKSAANPAQPTWAHQDQVVQHSMKQTSGKQSSIVGQPAGGEDRSYRGNSTRHKFAANSSTDSSTLVASKGDSKFINSVSPTKIARGAPKNPPNLTVLAMEDRPHPLVSSKFINGQMKGEKFSQSISNLPQMPSIQKSIAASSTISTMQNKGKKSTSEAFDKSFTQQPSSGQVNQNNSMRVSMKQREFQKNQTGANKINFKKKNLNLPEKQGGLYSRKRGGQQRDQAASSSMIGIPSIMPNSCLSVQQIAQLSSQQQAETEMTHRQNHQSLVAGLSQSNSQVSHKTSTHKRLAPPNFDRDTQQESVLSNVNRTNTLSNSCAFPTNETHRSKGLNPSASAAEGLEISAAQQQQQNMQMPFIGIKNYQQIIERAKGTSLNKRHRSYLTNMTNQIKSKSSLNMPGVPNQKKQDSKRNLPSDGDYLDYPNLQGETSQTEWHRNKNSAANSISSGFNIQVNQLSNSNFQSQSAECPDIQGQDTNRYMPHTEVQSMRGAADLMAESQAALEQVIPEIVIYDQQSKREDFVSDCGKMRIEKNELKGEKNYPAKEKPRHLSSFSKNQQVNETDAHRFGSVNSMKIKGIKHKSIDKTRKELAPVDRSNVGFRHSINSNHDSSQSSAYQLRYTDAFSLPTSTTNNKKLGTTKTTGRLSHAQSCQLSNQQMRISEILKQNKEGSNIRIKDEDIKDLTRNIKASDAFKKAELGPLESPAFLNESSQLNTFRQESTQKFDQSTFGIAVAAPAVTEGDLLIAPLKQTSEETEPNPRITTSQITEDGGDGGNQNNFSFDQRNREGSAIDSQDPQIVNNISLISQVSEEAKKVLERKGSAASFGSKNPCNDHQQEISFLDSQILKNDQHDTSVSFKEAGSKNGKESISQNPNSLTLPMLQQNQIALQNNRYRKMSSSCSVIIDSEPRPKNQGKVQIQSEYSDDVSYSQQPVGNQPNSSKNSKVQAFSSDEYAVQRGSKQSQGNSKQSGTESQFNSQVGSKFGSKRSSQKRGQSETLNKYAMKNDAHFKSYKQGQQKFLKLAVKVRMKGKNQQPSQLQTLTQQPYPDGSMPLLPHSHILSTQPSKTQSQFGLSKKDPKRPGLPPRDQAKSTSPSRDIDSRVPIDDFQKMKASSLYEQEEGTKLSQPIKILENNVAKKKKPSNFQATRQSKEDPTIKICETNVSEGDPISGYASAENMITHNDEHSNEPSLRRNNGESSRSQLPSFRDQGLSQIKQSFMQGISNPPSKKVPAAGGSFREYTDNCKVKQNYSRSRQANGILNSKELASNRTAGAIADDKALMAIPEQMGKRGSKHIQPHEMPSSKHYFNYQKATKVSKAIGESGDLNSKKQQANAPQVSIQKQAAIDSNRRWGQQTPLGQGPDIENIEKQQDNSGIRIEVSKNREVVQHLTAKFSLEDHDQNEEELAKNFGQNSTDILNIDITNNNLDSQVGQGSQLCSSRGSGEFGGRTTEKKGTSLLLFYDFNGFKSSLSHRSQNFLGEQQETKLGAFVNDFNQSRNLREGQNQSLQIMERVKGNSVDKLPQFSSFDQAKPVAAVNGGDTFQSPPPQRSRKQARKPIDSSELLQRMDQVKKSKEKLPAADQDVKQPAIIPSANPNKVEQLQALVNRFALSPCFGSNLSQPIALKGSTPAGTVANLGPQLKSSKEPDDARSKTTILQQFCSNQDEGSVYSIQGPPGQTPDQGSHLKFQSQEQPGPAAILSKEDELFMSIPSDKPQLITTNIRGFDCSFSKEGLATMKKKDDEEIGPGIQADVDKLSFGDGKDLDLQPKP